MKYLYKLIDFLTTHKLTHKLGVWLAWKCYHIIDKYYKKDYNELKDKDIDTKTDDTIESQYHNHKI